MRVFHRAVTKKRDQNIIVTSKRSTHSHRGAAHRTQHDTALPKHYKNVDGQPTARGAARNRVAKCTWCTAIKGRARQQKYSPHLCDCKGPDNANDCAGARLGTFLEDSDAGFMPSKHHLDLLDETVRA